MDLTKKLNLIGYAEGESKQLKNIDEVVDFICKNGKHGECVCLIFTHGGDCNLSRKKNRGVGGNRKNKHKMIKCKWAL